MADYDNYIKLDKHGVMRVGKTRVMLDSVIAAFRQGHSPESIRAQYPALSLEEVYGAITFCLARPKEIDAYLSRQDEVWKREKARAEQSAPDVVKRLREARGATAETQ